MASVLAMLFRLQRIPYGSKHWMMVRSSGENYVLGSIPHARLLETVVVVSVDGEEAFIHATVSYTHLTLPTNREV